MARPSSAAVRRVYGALVLALAAGVAYVAVRAYGAYARSARVAAVSPQTERFGVERMRAVYPDLSDTERERLLIERSSLYLEYEAYTGYREKAFRGRYVTVSTHGFRQHGAAVWPPPKDRIAVYLFGGSTAFGYGVADDQTIAAHLESILNAPGAAYAVYNFGRAGYFSTQERILFEQLVAGGVAPGIAVFLDGLNEFYNRDNLPSHYEDMYNYLDGVNAKVFRNRPFAPEFGIRDKVAPFGPIRASSEPDDAKESLLGVIRNWAANARILSAVARQNNVRPLFFWQPVPLYRCSPETNRFLEFLDPRHRRSEPGYRLFRELMEARSLDLPEGFHWLADLQEGRKDPLYLDTVHYTPGFSRDIASQIAGAIRQR